MVEENKVRVYAPIQVQEEVEKAAFEKAAIVAFPDEKQNDLQYIRAILVSAGTNKNGAHFLPSEMLKAHNTVVNKAIDIEHEEEKVIGHIYECGYLHKDGSPFDPQQLVAEYSEANKNLDDLDIDIMIAGVVHKMRFPEIAEEITNGDWKVSMECFFKDFDIKMGNTVISRQEAESLGYNPNDLIGGFVKIVAGNKALGKHFVSRVLRGITFSGMGMVKNPANPHSVVLETADHKKQLEKNVVSVDLEQIDNLRGHKVELSSESQDVQEDTEGLVKANVFPEGEDDTEEIFIEIDKDTGGVKRVFTFGGKDSASRYSGPGIGGPGSVLSFPDSVCKSFKKRHTRFNALDQSEAQVIHEHWCALFEEPCPVIGASAKAPECLRNVRNSVTRDPKDTTITKTIREHVDDAPSNTFTTVLQSSAAVEERRAQTSRIREQAEELRQDLKKFVAGKKKVLE